MIHITWYSTTVYQYRVYNTLIIHTVCTTYSYSIYDACTVCIYILYLTHLYCMYLVLYAYMNNEYCTMDTVYMQRVPYYCTYCTVQYVLYDHAWVQRVQRPTADTTKQNRLRCYSVDALVTACRHSERSVLSPRALKSIFDHSLFCSFSAPLE
jgi:hypothetical protein